MIWVRRVLLGLLVAIVAIAGGGWLVLQQTLPRTAGTLWLVGPGAEIEIVRDRHGIPHIEAKSVTDAYFALGFVHAQDRLWQMEVQRRIASGRLSEVFGARALDFDRTMRTLGLRRHAEASLAHLSPQARAALEAYAAGVNAQMKSSAWPPPPEFLVFTLTPEPWVPADSLGWLKMMAWDLGGSFRAELLRMALAKAGLTPQQIQEFLPPYPGDAPVALPDLAALYRDVGIDPVRLGAALPGAPGSGIGSNNWVVSGARSATGKPLLANDPHLGLSAPSIWYFAHWRAPEMNAIGATLPGVPMMVLGRNDRIAWGFTNTGPDVQDLYLEKVDPADPGRYLTPSGSTPFETRTELIRVKGAADVSLTVRRTRHGPVISDVMPRMGDLLDKGHVMAFAWTALVDDDRTAEAGLKALEAKTWGDFVAAFRDYVAPQQNIVYADADGNIGFLAPGRVPVRKPENDLNGQAPSPGWDARYDWAGFIPYDELPRSLNPASGKVVTANNKIVPPDYPHHITSDWQEPYRAQRITALVEARPTHSVESFKAIQGDVLSLPMLDLLPHLRAAPAASARAAQAIEMLRKWDGVMAADRAEPLIVSGWLRELSKAIYADELGPAFAEIRDIRPRFLQAVLADEGGQSRWCDDIGTPVRETCAQLLGRSLDTAIAALADTHGGDIAKWRWGEAHVARSRHRPFGGQPVLGDIFDIAVPTPGDGFTVNVGKSDMRDERDPFGNRHAASLRAVYDLADLDRSVFIHSTGQSGNVVSPHYDDLAEPWSRLGYLPMTTRRADYESGMIGRLMLRPVVP